MRTVTVDWQFPEVEDDEWATLIAQNPLQRLPPQASAWRHARAGVAIAGAIALLLALAGFRLWNEAQRGITQIEGDAVALVQAETLRQNVVEPSDQLQAAVQAVEIDRGGLMVRVVVTETNGLNYTWSFTESRFYRQSPSGWRRSDPLISFWGREATLDTANLHFTFRELDRSVVEEVAGQLDAYVGDLRGFLELPPLTPSALVKVTITPNQVTQGSTTADGGIIQPSPYVLRISTHGSEAAILFTHLRSLLLSQTMDEAASRANVRTEWRWMMESLHGWIERHSEPYLHLDEARTSSGDASRGSCPYNAFSILACMTELQTNGYWGFLTDCKTYGSDVFFGFVTSGRTSATIPKLLAAFGGHASWKSLVPVVFGIPYEELQHMMEKYEAEQG